MSLPVTASGNKDGAAGGASSAFSPFSTYSRRYIKDGPENVGRKSTEAAKDFLAQFRHIQEEQERLEEEKKQHEEELKAEAAKNQTPQELLDLFPASMSEGFFLDLNTAHLAGISAKAFVKVSRCKKKDMHTKLKFAIEKRRREREKIELTVQKKLQDEALRRQKLRARAAKRNLAAAAARVVDSRQKLMQENGIDRVVGDGLMFRLRNVLERLKFGFMSSGGSGGIGGRGAMSAIEARNKMLSSITSLKGALDSLQNLVNSTKSKLLGEGKGAGGEGSMEKASALSSSKDALKSARVADKDSRSLKERSAQEDKAELKSAAKEGERLRERDGRERKEERERSIGDKSAAETAAERATERANNSTMDAKKSTQDVARESFEAGAGSGASKGSGNGFGGLFGTERERQLSGGQSIFGRGNDGTLSSAGNTGGLGYGEGGTGAAAAGHGAHGGKDGGREVVEVFKDRDVSIINVQSAQPSSSSQEVGPGKYGIDGITGGGSGATKNGGLSGLLHEEDDDLSSDFSLGDIIIGGLGSAIKAGANAVKSVGEAGANVIRSAGKAVNDFVEEVKESMNREDTVGQGQGAGISVTVPSPLLADLCNSRNESVGSSFLSSNRIEETIKGIEIFKAKVFTSDECRFMQDIAKAANSSANISM